MRKGLGLGLVALGMLACASTANAVTYNGLAFNAVNQNFYFSSIADEENIWFNRKKLDNPNPDLSGIGQAVYDVDFFGNGGTITFQAGSVMNFGSTTMQITGGVLDIGTLNSPATPAVTLPFGFGTAVPDFELEGYIDVLLNGVAVRLHVCESTGGSNDCTSTGDDRPWGNSQPYNTLSVGNAPDNDDDVAMFLYMRGECLGENASACPFYDTWTTQEWTGQYEYDFYICTSTKNWYGHLYCETWQTVSNHVFSGHCGSNTTYQGKQVYKQKSTQTKLSHLDKGCKNKDKVYETVTHKDKDVFVKLALWGDVPSDEVPEPATLSLFGLGLIGVGAAVRRRRRAA